MWSRWSELYLAATLAETPHESLPTCLSGIEMLYASDLQWDRFVEAIARASADEGLPARWTTEAHFFLVAADNARDRMVVWAKSVDDHDLSRIVERLRMGGIKTFRNHQEHLEERMPGGEHQDRAHLPPPGNEFVRIEGGSGVVFVNNLRDGHILQFGAGEIDLAASHSTILEVSADLFQWLNARSLFPYPR